MRGSIKLLGPACIPSIYLCAIHLLWMRKSSNPGCNLKARLVRGCVENTRRQVYIWDSQIYLFSLDFEEAKSAQETRGAESMGRREDRVSSRGLIDICSGVEHSQSEREGTDGAACVCDNIIHYALLYICIRAPSRRVSAYIQQHNQVYYSPFL